MTTCHYCGELAVHKLDGMQTCYDCSVRLAGIPEDLKIPTLVNNLEAISKYVATLPGDSKTKPIWLDEIARRLHYVTHEYVPILKDVVEAPVVEKVVAPAVKTKGPIKVKLKKK
ncbi:MAG: hypothetical protein KDH16_22060 [Rhodocyclaceae bacterium]|nr:hypothetical protein [Rhodocyclaceae bacterium]